MKVGATYSCGHDATRDFDCRNMFRRFEANQWQEKAAERCCPKCRKEQRLALLASMDADTMRAILIDLISNSAVGAAIDDRR